MSDYAHDAAPTATADTTVDSRRVQAQAVRGIAVLPSSSFRASSPSDKPTPSERAGEGSAEHTSPDAVPANRLHIIVFCLCFGLFLSTLETTIVATALVTISSDFGQFELAGWIILSYLITYTGFLIVYARCSDFFGRKNAVLVALAFFTTFSLACGLAQTMEQLIVFRAFQGLGGSGIFSMVFVLIPEIVPPAKFGLVSGFVGATFASSSVLGPTLGGVITSNTTWRWVFLINVPCGVVIIALILWAYPQPKHTKHQFRNALARVDWPGVGLSLAGSALIVVALQEGGVQYPWNSSVVVACLVIAGMCWVAFVMWEIFLTRGHDGLQMAPIFPTRLAKHRVIGAALLCAFTTGFPFNVTIIYLPQRFQIVNGESPVDAGIKLLPLLLFSAIGSGVGGAIMNKFNVAFYVLVTSNILEILGTALLSSLPVTRDVPIQIYFFQAILGLGFGTSVVGLMVTTRLEVTIEDEAVSQGAITQVRVVGGVIGLAIATTVLLSDVKSQLSGVLSPSQLHGLLQSTTNIAGFSSAQSDATRVVYGNAFNLQMRIIMGFSIASLCISLWTFRKNPLSLQDWAQKKKESLEVDKIEAGTAQSEKESGDTKETDVILDTRKISSSDNSNVPTPDQHRNELNRPTF